MAGTSGAVVRAGVAVAERIAGAPARTAIAPKRAVYQSHTRRIFDDAHLFLAPSEFLRSRHVACGLPPHKVEYLRYGIRTFAARAPTPSAGRVRFGYIGALHAHKGIELLIAALAGLEGRAELHIYGSAFGSPITSRFVERVTAAAASHVVFHGPYENAAIAEILASLDAVVVPSIWYENSPLTIQEAFVGRVPVITADQGGMAELVRHDVDGLHFRLGDAADLRRVMQTVVDDPGLLPRLRLNIPPVPHIEGQTEKVRARYEALLTAR
jgi:glycosyltransferase involved in cell wall biosynthesis